MVLVQPHSGSLLAILPYYSLCKMTTSAAHILKYCNFFKPRYFLDPLFVYTNSLLVLESFFVQFCKFKINAPQKVVIYRFLNIAIAMWSDIWNVSYLELRVWNNFYDHSLLDFKSAVQYMKHFIYHFTVIPRGLIRTHKWPAANVSGFITQLVRASHRYHKVTGSNPVEVLTFSGFYTQLLKLRS